MRATWREIRKDGREKRNERTGGLWRGGPAGAGWVRERGEKKHAVTSESGCSLSLGPEHFAAISKDRTSSKASPLSASRAKLIKVPDIERTPSESSTGWEAGTLSHAPTSRYRSRSRSDLITATLIVNS